LDINAYLDLYKINNIDVSFEKYVK